MINLIKGFSYLFQGLGLLTQKGIRPFVILPLLINIAVFSFAVWFSANQLDFWLEKLLPSWLSWLEWLLWPIFSVLFFLIVFYTFTIIANLVAAPFNAVLSERIENKLKGQPVPKFQGYKNLTGLIVRTFKSESQKLFYMAKWFIALIIIMLIPGVNLIAPVAWVIFGAWMLAVEYIDYPMGNHNLFFKEELSTLRRNRPLALGFGGSLALMTSIPILNFFAMPAGVAGSTVLWVKQLSRKQS